MEIEIRRLTPDVLDDFLDFFDNRAFHDHKAWSRCYCLSPHEPAPDSEKGQNRRKRAADYVLDGRMQGYLAYADGAPIGWCNANDRANYGRLAASKRVREESGKGMRVKSIMCFCVAPEMRGKGVATALLQRVCEDAKDEGFDCVEAYPRKNKTGQFDHFHGPSAMYERQGLVIHREFAWGYIVRTKE